MAIRRIERRAEMIAVEARYSRDRGSTRGPRRGDVTRCQRSRGKFRVRAAVFTMATKGYGGNRPSGRGRRGSRGAHRAETHRGSMHATRRTRRPGLAPPWTRDITFAAASERRSPPPTSISAVPPSRRRRRRRRAIKTAKRREPARDDAWRIGGSRAPVKPRSGRTPHLSPALLSLFLPSIVVRSRDGARARRHPPYFHCTRRGAHRGRNGERAGFALCHDSIVHSRGAERSVQGSSRESPGR